MVIFIAGAILNKLIMKEASLSSILHHGLDKPNLAQTSQNQRMDHSFKLPAVILELMPFRKILLS